MAKGVTTILALTVILTIISRTNAQTCNAEECHFDPNRDDPHVTCNMSPYGGATVPCYGEWSSITDCVCDAGYRISNTGSTYWCTDDAWAPNIYDLRCIGPCTIDAGENVIAHDSNGNLVTDGLISDGDFVVYSCPSGYSPNGDSTVTCTNGTWADHTIFNCLAGCNFPNFTSPTNTKVTEPVNHGDVISLQCDEGYLPRDIRSSTCTDGTFVPDVTCSVEQCAVDQCELSVDSFDPLLSYQAPQRYGNLAPPNYCYGVYSYIDFTGCNKANYVLRPVVSISYCVQDGRGGVEWDHDIHNLTCHAPCNVLQLPTDVEAQDHTGNPVSSVQHEQYITYVCITTTDTIVGVTTTTCDSGTWDTTETPVCHSSCNFPSNSHSTQNEPEPIAHGDTVILQCNDGFQPRDTVTAQCIDGVFTPKLTCTSV